MVYFLVKKREELPDSQGRRCLLNWTVSTCGSLLFHKFMNPQRGTAL